MARLGLPLDAFGERSPYRLSGGEQRRLSLATALVREPAVLVLDEPTFGQDRHGYDGPARPSWTSGCTPATASSPRPTTSASSPTPRDRVIRLDDGRIVADEAVRDRRVDAVADERGCAASWVGPAR